MVIIQDASVKVWKIFMQDMMVKYWEKVEPLLVLIICMTPETILKYKYLRKAFYMSLINYLKQNI